MILPKAASGARKKCPAHEPEGHSHPKKIFKTAGIVSDAPLLLGGRAKHVTPGQWPNLAYCGLPENTGQIRGCGLITRRSEVQILPPPPRPLVRRAPRAGVQVPDQRFLIPALVGDASFSGVFLGACSSCPVQGYAGCARRDMAGELRFRIDRHADAAGRRRVAQACTGHAYAVR